MILFPTHNPQHVIEVKSGLSMAAHLKKDVLRCVFMVTGGLCAMTFGQAQTLKLSADNLCSHLQVIQHLVAVATTSCGIIIYLLAIDTLSVVQPTQWSMV